MVKLSVLGPIVRGKLKVPVAKINRRQGVSTLVNDPYIEQHLLAERRANGLDRWDEVWEGTYIIMPSPNNEHQDLIGGLMEVIRPIVRKLELGTFHPSVNVSDRQEDWKSNYRIPDGAFFGVDNPAKDCGTFWYGGPDLAIEIVNPGDRAREKFDFYGSVGTRELLLVDRQPWQLELYAAGPKGFELQEPSRPGNDVAIALQTLPITLTLKAANPRPRMLVECEQLAMSEFV